MQTRQVTPVHRRPAAKWLKRGLFAVLVLGGVALLVSSLMPQPVPVDFAAAETRPLTVTVDEDGVARVKDRYVVSAPLGGRMARLELEAGQDVTRGQVLARIIPHIPPLLDARTKTEAQARVQAATAARRQAAAQVDRAAASLEFARRETARHRRLARDQITTQRELEEVRLAERTAAAQLDSARFAQRVAEHELRMAEAALGQLRKAEGRGGRGGQAGAVEQLTVTAPVSGRVLRVEQESEGVVQAGTALLVLGDPAALEVVVDVLTRDAVRIRPGAEVRVDRWGGPDLRGRVRHVEPSAFTRLSALGVEEQRVNVLIDLIDDREAWSALGDGYRVEAHIVVWQRADALTVPASAVFRHDGGWAVYRVDDGRAQRVALEIGQRTARWAEVADGLSPGATVVVHPSDQIQPGVAVAARQR